MKGEKFKQKPEPPKKACACGVDHDKMDKILPIIHTTFRSIMEEKSAKAEQDVDTTLRSYGIDPVTLGKRGEALARVCLANEQLKNVIKKIFPGGHDLVCNGDHSLPVGVSGNSCSCIGRLERRILNADALAICVGQAIAYADDNAISSEWQSILQTYRQIRSCQNGLHHENCDVNDWEIREKPCNCRGRR